MPGRPQSGIAAGDGAVALFTVSGQTGQTLTLALITGTASSQPGTPADDGTVDFGPALEVYRSGAWQPYTAGTGLTLTGPTLLVRTPIIDDTPFEGQERFSLGVTLEGQTRAVVGQGSIHDDGTGAIYTGANTTGVPQTATEAGLTASDDRRLSVADSSINEASDQAVMTVTGDPGQSITLDLLNNSQSGTVSGQANLQSVGSTALLRIFSGNDSNGDAIWLDYDSEAALPAFDRNGRVYVRVDTRSEQDPPFEGTETIRLQATLATQSVTVNGVTNTPLAASAATGTLGITDDGSGLRFTPAMTALTGNAGWTAVTIATGLDDDRPVTPPGPPVTLPAAASAAANGPLSQPPGPAVIPPVARPAAPIILAVPEPVAAVSPPARDQPAAPGPTPRPSGDARGSDAVQRPPPGPSPQAPGDAGPGSAVPGPGALPGNSRDNGIDERDPAPASAPLSERNTADGFQVRIDPGLRIGGEHELRIDRAIPDLALSGRTAAIDFVIPTDAFVHTDVTAEVRLFALMLDGSELPAWIGFDPETGRLG